MQEIDPPIRLTAFEYRGRMKGQSRPMVFACSDPHGAEYRIVLKLRNPARRDGTFGPASLASELCCAMIARLAGMIVPDYFIVAVPDDPRFFRSISDAETRAELVANIGDNFGSEYLEDHANFMPELLHGRIDTSRAEEILAFDAYVLNNDRKEENPNLLVRGNTLVLIDHALGFPHIDFPDLPAPWEEILPDPSVKGHCTYRLLKTASPRFEAFAEFAKRDLTNEHCKAILDHVPETWQRPGSSDKDLILKYLLKRPDPFVAKGVENLVRVCWS